MNVWWLCAGAMAGAVNALTLRWTVARLQPGLAPRALGQMWGGALLRWVISAVVLLAALQQGVMAGLLAFGGLWLSRWLLVVAYWLSERE